MVSFYMHAYISETNMCKPLISDGTDLSNFIIKREGYYGNRGDIIRQYKATNELLLSYARGFLITEDENLWYMARGIAKDSSLGDMGANPGKKVDLNFNTQCSDPYALFSI